MTSVTGPILVLLGSNIDAEQNLRAAVHLLSERVGVQAVSGAYESEPVGSTGQPCFLNAAVVVRTDLSPDRLKAEVLRPIEAELGRVRTADKFAPRTIDLDLVLYGDLVLVEAGLIRIPDPNTLRYPHVALPIAELAPDFAHPVDGRTLAAIAAAMTDQTGIRRLPDVNLWLPPSTTVGPDRVNS